MLLIKAQPAPQPSELAAGDTAWAGEEAQGPAEVTLPGFSISDGGESGSDGAGGM